MPIRNRNGDKYAQIAADWGTDVGDASIRLLQEFDGRFDEVKRENSETKEKIDQWATITSQLLRLVSDHKEEVKALSSDTNALSNCLEKLKQDLQKFEQSISKQDPTLAHLSKDIQKLILNLETSSASIQQNQEDLKQTIGGALSQSTLFESVSRISKKIVALSDDRRIMRLALGALASLVLVQFFWLNQQINRVNNNVNTGLVGIERLRENR